MKIELGSNRCTFCFIISHISELLRGGSEVANKELKRGLGARHIQMIALGGTIGVGLFMGSSSTIE